MAVDIVHVITTLDTGGAEAMLYKLLRHWPRESGAAHHVVSLKDMGAYGAKIAAMGIGVTVLDMPAGRATPGGMARLYALLRQRRVDIVQTWLYHADLLGLILGKMSGVSRVVWNIRCSRMDLGRYSRSTRLVFSALVRLSCLPDAVVANSAAGRAAHEAAGYRPRQWRVLPNGFDTNLFRPDASAREALRQELGISAEAPVIGMVARFDPMKAHDTFFAAAARLRRWRPGIRFALVGEGMTADNRAVMSLIRRHDLHSSVRLLGRRDGLQRCYPAFDLHTLSSAFGEGFPNVIGEAMACGVPCVATDVGDSAAIIQETGMVAGPNDPSALAEAWEAVLSMSPEARAALGRRARERIVNTYEISKIAKAYDRLYNELCAA